MTAVDRAPWEDEPPTWSGDEQPWPDSENAEGPTGFAATIVTRSGLANLPPAEPLIEGIISRPAAAVLVGKSGAGKSFLALAWACCVGGGLPWLGRAVERTKVLYVVGEGATGLDQRITAWEAAWGQEIQDDEVIFSVKPQTLLHPAVWKDVTQQSLDMGVGFVVLDTFSSLYPDADETKDAAQVTRRLSDLSTAIDGTALLVHHPGWGDEERPRGGSQLLANVDEVLFLRGTPQDPNLTLVRQKAKDDALGSDIHLLRKVTRGSCVIEGRSSDSVSFGTASAAEEALRRTFGDAPFGKSQARDALMEALGLSSKTSGYAKVTELINAGVITRAGGTDTRPTYVLAPHLSSFPDSAFAPREPF